MDYPKHQYYPLGLIRGKMPTGSWLARLVAPPALVLTLACDPSSITSPEHSPEVGTVPSLAVALSSYFPPSEAKGGWRNTADPTRITSLGMSPSKLAAFRTYTMSLPWEQYETGITGYSASNKASLVIKNGWIVGEYYNKASARTAVYYLASNGKSFGIMLFGRMLLDYPELAITPSSKLYDTEWLPQGFPLTDKRKADITFDHVFGHVSGIVPEPQATIASGAVKSGPNWNFEPFTTGHDPDYPVSGPLYFTPGDSSTYTKGRPYSSVAFNHLGLVFRNVTGLEASLYLRSGILDRIGVGRMAYVRPQGMGDVQWAVGGNQLASARDYARLAYLLLHEGDWNGRRIFAASWIRRFIRSTEYYNLRSNMDCFWGRQYPKDMYRITGSGLNWAFIVPSLDLIATLNGRTPNSLSNQVVTNFLQKLFESVTQQYEACDGRTINSGPPSTTSPRVSALWLMNAETDEPLLQLTDGMTITLADLPTSQLNVKAETSPSLVGSVRFALDANSNYRTETNAPYALAGDDQGNYNPWTPSPGTHSLRATPYTGASATGTAGTALSIGFTVR